MTARRANGQLYATLSRLARDGKVVAGDSEPGAGPDRKRYVITDLGVTEVEKWLAEPIEAEPNLQTVLFIKVVLALMLGHSADWISWRGSAGRRAATITSQPGRRTAVRCDAGGRDRQGRDERSSLPDPGFIGAS